MKHQSILQLLVLCCFQSFQVSAIWQKSAKAIVNDNLDGTGHSVSFSSPLIAVGAPFSSSQGQAAGEARVYYRDGKKSILLGDPIQGLEGEELGFSVAVCSKSNFMRVVVGAPMANGDAIQSGYAKVYDFDDRTMKWVLVGKGISGTVTNQKTGSKVAISEDGTLVAVAGYGSDGLERGVVSLYTFNNASEEWEIVGNPIEGHMEEARFGSSLSILTVEEAGTHSFVGLKRYFIGIGAPGYSQSRGLAQVYQFDDYLNDWSQLGEDIQGDKVLGRLGASISMGLIGSHIVVAVGLPSDTPYYGDARDLQGQVNMYKHTIIGEDDWEMFADPIKNVEADDSTGFSVALSKNGMRLAIGSPQYGDRNGLVRIYDLDMDTSNYKQVGNNIVGKENGEFGFALDISEGEIAVGTPYMNMVEIFYFDGSMSRTAQKLYSGFSYFIVLTTVFISLSTLYIYARKRGFKWSSLSKSLKISSGRRNHHKLNTDEEEWPFPFFTSSERERIAQVMRNESAKGNDIDGVVLHGLHRRINSSAPVPKYQDEVEHSGSSESENDSDLSDSDEEYELKQIT